MIGRRGDPRAGLRVREAGRPAALDPLHRADPGPLPVGHQRPDADADRVARPAARPRLPRRRLLLGRAARRAGHQRRQLAGRRRCWTATECCPDAAPHDARSLPDRAGVPRQHLSLADGPRGARAAARPTPASATRSRWHSSGTGGWHAGRPDGRAGRRDPGRGRASTRAGTAPAPSTPAGTTTTTWCSRWTRQPARRRRQRTSGRRCSAPSIRSIRRATDPEVPDPYYGGAAGFEEVLRMVERTSASLVAVLRRELGQELART